MNLTPFPDPFFPEEEKQTVRELLEGLILKHQARRWNTAPRTAAR